MTKHTRHILIVVFVTLLTGLLVIAGIGIAQGQTVQVDQTGNDVTVTVRIITEGTIIGADTVYVSLPADTVYVGSVDTVIVREIEYIDRIDTVEIVRFDTTYIDRIVTDTLYVELTDTVYVTQIDTVFVTEYEYDEIYLPGDTVYVEIPCPVCPDIPDEPDTTDSAERQAWIAAHPPDRTLFFWRYSDGAVPADTGRFISQYVRESDQFGFVLYVSPRNLTDAGPARFVTISFGSHDRNFMIGQTRQNVMIRIRNTGLTTPHLGDPGILLENVITQDYIDNPDRVMLFYILYDQGLVSVYLNTELVHSETYTGDASTWDDFPIRINDEFNASRPSAAVIRQFEFYTFLDETDIAAKNDWLNTYAYNRASVILGWETVAGAVEYELEVYTDPGLTDLAERVTTPDTEYAFWGFKTETYYYRVRAVNADAVSDWSETGTFTLPIDDE